MIAALSGQDNVGKVQSELAVRLLRKANDQMEQQGEAMVALLEKAGQPVAEQYHLDAYA